MDDLPRIAFKFTVRGVVQGVGFRPTVKRVADGLSLAGWVRNTGTAVEIWVEGAQAGSFLPALQTSLPPHARLELVDVAPVDPQNYAEFAILQSADDAGARALIPPDIATCPDCLAEMTDSHDRRFHYPFINCTNCGPRYTIVERVPYDRANTSMSGFALCPDCAREYGDPTDRRYHAEPIACPVCGPHITLFDSQGKLVAKKAEALTGAARALTSGKIVAIKGLGGFHLACDAANDEAVKTLRERKGREAKPLAVMVALLEVAERLVNLSEQERELLTSASAPIVLAAIKPGAKLAFAAINSDTDRLGLMLPYTPLHHLLLQESPPVLVMTSGNLADEPLATNGAEAIQRLGKIADLFLGHNRPIVTPCDDSVVQLIEGEPAFLRRSRGFSPARLNLGELGAGLKPCLGIGADLKNAPAFIQEGKAFLVPHVGDLDNFASEEHCMRLIKHIESLFALKPELVCHDLHPDFASTRIAQSLGIPTLAVQHHHAHLAALLAEHKHQGRLLALTLDGFGLGDDNTAWGGEMLLGDASGFERVGYLRQLPLPGGDAASKQGWRMALSLLRELHGDGWRDCMPELWEQVGMEKAEAVAQMIAAGINSPLTSSAGRLFDAVAAILGIAEQSAYEGQAAMRLEAVAQRTHEERELPFSVAEDDKGRLVIDLWEALDEMRCARQSGIKPAVLARSFHRVLAKALCYAVELRLPPNTAVGLSGGVWNNQLLTGLVVDRLRWLGMEVLVHREVPPGDGCIGLGQALVGAMG